MPRGSSIILLTKSFSSIHALIILQMVSITLSLIKWEFWWVLTRLDGLRVVGLLCLQLGHGNYCSVSQNSFPSTADWCGPHHIHIRGYTIPSTQYSWVRKVGKVGLLKVNGHNHIYTTSLHPTHSSSTRYAMAGKEVIEYADEIPCTSLPHASGVVECLERSSAYFIKFDDFFLFSKLFLLCKTIQNTKNYSGLQDTRPCVN